MRPDQSRDRKGGHREIDDLARAIIILASLFALGLLAFILTLALPGPISLLIPIACLFWCIRKLIRAKTWTLRGGLIAGTLLVIAFFIFIMPSDLDAVRHDRIMARVEAAVCSEPAPLGATLIRCDGTRIENPFNGNQCGYQVNLWIRTRLPVRQLGAYYGRAGQLPTTLNGLDITMPYVRYVGPGVAKAEFLAVGDAGLDWRCN